MLVQLLEDLPPGRYGLIESDDSSRVDALKNQGECGDDIAARDWDLK
jgi:hypothetical protein